MKVFKNIIDRKKSNLQRIWRVKLEKAGVELKMLCFFGAKDVINLIDSNDNIGVETLYMLYDIERTCIQECGFLLKRKGALSLRGLLAAEFTNEEIVLIWNSFPTEKTFFDGWFSWYMGGNIADALSAAFVKKVGEYANHTLKRAQIVTRFLLKNEVLVDYVNHPIWVREAFFQEGEIIQDWIDNNLDTFLEKVFPSCQERINVRVKIIQAVWRSRAHNPSRCINTKSSAAILPFKKDEKNER